MEEKEIFHIYNRGVEKRDIFLDTKDYERFVISLEILNTTRNITIRDELDHRQALSGNPRQRLSVPEETLVSVMAYCLMPNHFHLLLQENKPGYAGVFMKKITMGYSKYFNIKYQRSGVLFQGRNKYKILPDDESILYVSAYIHANPTIAKLTSSSGDWRWSNYNSFTQNILTNSELFDILPHQYQQYVNEVKNNQQDKKRADIELD